MHNAGKQVVISSCLQRTRLEKVPQLSWILCFRFYRDLASEFGFPPLTMKEKTVLKVSPLCSLHQVKATDDLHQRLGQRYCLKVSSEFQLHCALPLFFSAWLVHLGHNEQKVLVPPCPDELLRDKWIRVCFLAALSEESILFIAAGWATEEWLANTRTGNALNLGQSRTEEALKLIDRCPKRSSPSPDNKLTFCFCLPRLIFGALPASLCFCWMLELNDAEFQTIFLNLSCI